MSNSEPLRAHPLRGIFRFCCHGVRGFSRVLLLKKPPMGQSGMFDLENRLAKIDENGDALVRLNAMIVTLLFVSTP